jgi:hypothetical protein
LTKASNASAVTQYTEFDELERVKQSRSEDSIAMKFEIDSHRMSQLLEQLRSIVFLNERPPVPVFQASYGTFDLSSFTAA